MVPMLAAATLLSGPLLAQTNPRVTFSVDGPCGETIVGPPGSVYDDGTGGAPYFNDHVRTPEAQWVLVP